MGAMGAVGALQAAGEGQARASHGPLLLPLCFSGNSQSRFSLQGAVLVHNDLMLAPPWPEQSHTCELLIRVADAGPSTPHLSTTATVIVHIVPWRASTGATSIHRTTVRGCPQALTGWGEKI